MDHMNTINELDFNTEFNRLQRKAGLSAETASEALDLYRKFIFLRLKYGTGITPSKLIDYAWHEHLSDTQKYADDCIKLCGTVLHHNPNITGNIMEERFEHTNELFKKEFGIDLTRVAEPHLCQAESCGM